MIAPCIEAQTIGTILGNRYSNTNQKNSQTVQNIRE